VAEDDDFPVPVELRQPTGNLAHGNENGPRDRRGRVLEGFAHVEEQGAFRVLPGGGRRRIDLDRRQNPSRMLVTSDWAKRPASASMATFSRSEKFDDPTPPPAIS